MKKWRFLLLDANVVIKLHELSLWDRVVERCDLLIARTVIDHEAVYYEMDEGRQLIDLTTDLKVGRITVVEVDATQVKAFLDQFDPVYLGEMDPGETESLTYLANCEDFCLICSSDAIVFRVLGRLNLAEQGVSLETILRNLGLGRSLPKQYSDTFRNQWTNRGKQEMVRGIGLR